MKRILKSAVAFVAAGFILLSCASVGDKLTARSTWHIYSPLDGKTFPVKVLKNDGKTITFQMPIGTLDCPIDRIEILSADEHVIRINAKSK